ncbi:MAG: hypothetical protein AAF092_16465 [Pseudomonadota bacterium]
MIATRAKIFSTNFAPGGTKGCRLKPTTAGRAPRIFEKFLAR